MLQALGYLLMELEEPAKDSTRDNLLEYDEMVREKATEDTKPRALLHKEFFLGEEEEEPFLPSA